jgi:hypothetical protein
MFVRFSAGPGWDSQDLQMNVLCALLTRPRFPAHTAMLAYPRTVLPHAPFGRMAG